MKEEGRLSRGAFELDLHFGSLGESIDLIDVEAWIGAQIVQNFEKPLAKDIVVLEGVVEGVVLVSRKSELVHSTQNGESIKKN